MLNKWEGKDKQWETLRFPQWFDLLPKQKFAKNKKHQKTNFEVSKFDMFLAVFCELCILQHDGALQWLPPSIAVQRCGGDLLIRRV